MSPRLLTAGLLALGACTPDYDLSSIHQEKYTQNDSELEDILEDQENEGSIERRDDEDFSSYENPNNTEESETETTEGDDAPEYSFQRVRELCTAILTQEEGHCVLDLTTGDYAEDCVESVEQVGESVKNQWYEGVSGYFGHEVNDSNIDLQEWTIFTWNDGDSSENGYAATISIAPGHHNSLYPDGWFTPWDTIELPILRCTHFPGTSNTYNGYYDSNGDLVEEAYFHYQGDYSETGDDFVTVNELESYLCPSDNCSATTSESASERIGNELYEVSMDLVGGEGSNTVRFN